MSGAPTGPMDDGFEQERWLRERFLQSVRSWLTRSISLADLKATTPISESAPSFRKDYEEFIAAATDAHEIWEFNSPKSEWDRMAGRKGFALVKNGVVTHVLVTIAS